MTYDSPLQTLNTVFFPAIPRSVLSV